MDPTRPQSVSKEQEVDHFPTPMHRDPVSAREEIAAWEALHRAEQLDLQARYSHFYVGARVLMGALFLYTALGDIQRFDAAANAVTSAGFFSARFLLMVAILLRLVGGAMLAIGWRVRVAAAGLIAYLVTATVLLNWDQTVAMNRVLAIGNLAFIAGLLALAGHGSGGSSVDRLLAHRRTRKNLGASPV